MFFCGCEDVPNDELTLDIRSGFKTIKGLRVIGWKCSQCGEEYYDSFSVKLQGILQELVEKLHPPYSKEEDEEGDWVRISEIIKEKYDGFTSYRFSKYVNNLKQRFFEQEDLDFMLNKSMNNDRFSSALFLYSITEHKLLINLIKMSNNNSFVRVQLRNLYYLLNEATFDNEEINNLSLDLRKRLNAWGGNPEIIMRELPDYRLETMKKMYYDLYLTYRADRPTSDDEWEHIKKVLGLNQEKEET